MGNPNAKVKLVEFGSLTCPHCAEFDEKGGKPLIDNYVKTGLVSCEFRNFVRDPFDMTASLVARCGGETSFFGLTRGLYRRPAGLGRQDPGGRPGARCRRSRPCRRRSSSARSPRSPASSNWAAMRGVPRGQDRRSAWPNQAEVNQLVQMNSDAVSTYNIPGTPTFLINGELVDRDGDLGTAGTQDQGSARRLRWAQGRGSTVAVPPAQAQRLQELRRAGRAADRAGADRGRRPQWLRQVEPARSHPLGDGRRLAQVAARRRHGGCHLRRHGDAPGARLRRSLAADRTRAWRRRTTTPTAKARSPGGSSAAPAPPIGSTAATSGRRTCRCCSPTPRPARIRRRWSARGGSAR